MMCVVLSGCGFNQTNALDLQPIASYKIEENPRLDLSSDQQEALLAFCERTPTDVLPAKRAQVATVTFRHPIYDVLGEQTIHYWSSGETRYLSCATTNVSFDRTFKIEPIPVFERLVSSIEEETEVIPTIRFDSIQDVETIARQFHVNEAYETIVEGTTFAYQTPDDGSLYVTYETFRDGRTLDPVLEPGLFEFESGKNEGFSFVTKRTDGVISLQIGNPTSLERVTLPSLFVGNYMKVDAKEQSLQLEGDYRQLIKRVVVSDRPITDDIDSVSSLALSERYGTVLEVWGHVRKSTPKLTGPKAATTIRLATFETEGQTTMLDGPATGELFDWLAEAAAVKRPQGGDAIGRFTIYEKLTSQTFDVIRKDDVTYLIDSRSKRAYSLSREAFHRLTGR